MQFVPSPLDGAKYLLLVNAMIFVVGVKYLHACGWIMPGTMHSFG